MYEHECLNPECRHWWRSARKEKKCPICKHNDITNEYYVNDVAPQDTLNERKELWR